MRPPWSNCRLHKMFMQSFGIHKHKLNLMGSFLIFDMKLLHGIKKGVTCTYLKLLKLMKKYKIYYNG